MDTQTKQPYLVANWQALMQQLVFLAGQGYTYYYVAYLPKEKEHKFPAIDTKLIAKYQTNVSKYQRYRLKQKNRANFMYLRWEHIVVILHTNGDIPIIEGIDAFKNIRDSSIVIQLSKYLSLSVVLDNGKSTVKLHKESYRTFKMMIEGYAKQQQKRKIIETIQKLNGIPAYKGIFEQKKQLVQFAIQKLEDNGVYAGVNEFRVTNRRKLYTVFT
jgi:hypothetical protein